METEPIKNDMMKIRLQTNQKELFNEICRRMGTDSSTIIRQFIILFIKNHKEPIDDWRTTLRWIFDLFEQKEK